MKKNLQVFFRILCLSIILPQCKKDEKPYRPVKVCNEISNKKEVIDKYLQGTWKWLEDKSYDRSGAVRYQTPKTVGFQEKILIDESKITFTRTKISGQEITVFNYKLLLEGELTTFQADSAWVLAIYDTTNSNLLNWWRVYICQRNIIFANAYRGEVYPDRTYLKQ